MTTHFLLIVLLITIGSTAAQNCQVANASKIDCKQGSQQACEVKSCCWVPAGRNSAIPWCFYPAGHQACSKILVSNSTSAPFSESEIATMQGYFLKNINIDGQGGVVASPDTNVYKGGTYYFHWERDGALSMRTLFEIFPSSKSLPYMESYVKWVLRAQSDTDPHGIDVRVEPKYMLPQGEVYTGGWCRPQTDGPALRATTLIEFANSGSVSSSYITQYLWTTMSGGQSNGGAIAYDLDWVSANWESSGCDLWEELSSNDFFWNRMSFYRALSLGARFASKMGDAARASKYSAAADAVKGTLASHWNGGYIFESSNRQLDTSVICALNDAQDPEAPIFPPSSNEVASTITALSNLFCDQLPMNNADTASGIPGLVYGRYEGDSYGMGGGGGWVLLTAAVAEQLYRGANFIATSMDADVVTPEAEATFRALFSNNNYAMDVEKMPLSALLLSAGDGIMERIRVHVEPQGFHLYEQLNRDNGQQQSAYDLTWSYSAVLKALHYRSSVVSTVKKHAQQ